MYLYFSPLSLISLLHAKKWRQERRSWHKTSKLVLEVKFNFTSPNPNTEKLCLKPSLFVSSSVYVYFLGDGAILSLFGDDFALKFGICVKCSFSSIRLERLEENCLIWTRIYFRKLSLFHRPMRRMVESLIFANFMDIVPPDRIEWVPISFGPKPRSFMFIDFTVLRRKSMLSLLEIWYNLLFWSMTLIGVLDVVFL